jgi:uncharacterized protein (DUF1800 family)
MRIAFVLSVALLTAASGLQAARAAIPNDREAVTHALNRLAFGPRQGDVARVLQMGLHRWIDQQLQPDRVNTDAVDARLARLTTLKLDSATIARDIFMPARQARQARQRAAGQASDAPMPPPMREPGAMTDPARQEQRVFLDLAEAKLLRAAYSDRQLEEVLVDFWFNHFNVFARKAQTGIYLGEYEREAIRPHVFGKFRDLLGATAKSPAMLVYLDNWQSVAPNARMVANQQRPRGLNENYARELLELHTLGVDGGYTQQDIVHVARAFTGWTIGRPGEIGFRFAPFLHDRDAKTVLGHTIDAGGGMNDGERVLDTLASHPSTARHIAFKLAQRFVSDTPPAALVDRTAKTFQSTSGDLREVVRLIVTSPEFFSKDVRHAKIKTPFEFVASALRVADADVRNGMALVRALADMGMPLYMCQPPTGYDDTAEAWVSSGALVSRINFAVSLSRGEVRGVQVAKSAAPGRDGLDALQLGSAEFQRQ